jgi:hypothetical protein
VIRLVGRHAIVICQLPMNLRVEIGECCTHVGIELPHTRFVWRRAWLGFMVNRMVGEQFMECVEVLLPLDLFITTCTSLAPRRSSRT